MGRLGTQCACQQPPTLGTPTRSCCFWDPFLRFPNMLSISGLGNTRKAETALEGSAPLVRHKLRLGPRACPAASRLTHPRAALLYRVQHPQRAGRAGAEIEEVQRSARRQLQDPAWQPHGRGLPGDVGVLRVRGRRGSSGQCETRQQPEAQQQRQQRGSTGLHERERRGPTGLRGWGKLARSSPNPLRGARGNRPRRPLPSAPGSPPFLASSVQAEGPEAPPGERVRDRVPDDAVKGDMGQWGASLRAHLDSGNLASRLRLL